MLGWRTLRSFETTSCWRFNAGRARADKEDEELHAHSTCTYIFTGSAASPHPTSSHTLGLLQLRSISSASRSLKASEAFLQVPAYAIYRNSTVERGRRRMHLPLPVRSRSSDEHSTNEDSYWQNNSSVNWYSSRRIYFLR